MVRLAEIWACSGNSWENNHTACNYTFDSQTIASQFNQKDLKIVSVRHADGIHETPSYIPGTDQHFHGSGSVIINTSDIGEIAVSAWVRYDPNTKYSHKPLGNHLNIDLYWYHRADDGTITTGCINGYRRHPIHASLSRNGRVKLIDIYNENGVFSDHILTL